MWTDFSRRLFCTLSLTIVKEKPSHPSGRVRGGSPSATKRAMTTAKLHSQEAGSESLKSSSVSPPSTLAQKYEKISHPVLCALFFEISFFYYYYYYCGWHFLVSALQPLAIGDPTEVHCPRECVCECVWIKPLSGSLCIWIGACT